MTPLSIILSGFPALALLAATASLIWTCYHPNFFSIILFFFFLYGFPLCCYRLHQHFYPVREGVSYLVGTDYSPWWGSHQLQIIYIAFPALETALRLIPGLFSLWLRLWGAKVGKNVYWTPKLEIADRAFLEIGDRVVFGYDIQLYAHVIKPKKDNLRLYLKKITIGSHVFLGAGSRLGPGSIVADGSYVPLETDLHPHQKYDSKALESAVDSPSSS